MIDHSSTQSSGKDAEELARLHLQQHGLKLLAQNWSCRRGELDLVMLDADTVVFVEVRYRRHSAWGGAVESVDARKRDKLTKAAMHFLQQESRWAKHPCRFDVIAINAEGNSTPRLNWIQNAFDT
ncbi:YraN family protein [Pseudomonas sp. MMS21 TM103]|uniref:YraN family protein n=1 Tax=Pseudomonas sp. MMS21 TM103 TaxID=2886506 RepID=UPI0022AA6106|nr:YraN family protein [Pseudomonas sp. MMS21 TM103]